MKEFALNLYKKANTKGGSPGLVVMGGDSCSEDCGFGSKHHILDVNFFKLFVERIVMLVWKEENK